MPLPRPTGMNEYTTPQQQQPLQNLPQVYQQGQPGPGWQQPPSYGPPQPWQQPYPQPVQVAPRSPALGLIVSFFLPGVGSMMAGRTGKGIGILCGYFVGWLLCFVFIGFIVMPAFWIWGLIAGYADAVDWNRAHGIVS